MVKSEGAIDPTGAADPGARPGFGAGGWARIGLVAAVALGGWGWGAWEHFVMRPRIEDITRITFTLGLVDRFDDTDAHRAYVQLASDMKPWWDQIDELQRRIQAATSDEAREPLIAERDASLITFIRDHGLTAKTDLLIRSFDEFTRCLNTGVCDPDVLDKAISIDVKRIYRTFRPYMLMKRGDGKVEDKDFGKELEDLFFRFVG